ncbi:MAG: hypothetical protein LCH46_08245 [Proteobacteria bacterium]|nr:hypothetical protein [Pseudomonadota bacterium]
MKTRVFVSALLGLTLAASAANALTIQNTDAKDYTVMLKPLHGKELKVSVKANATINHACKTGSQVMLGDDHETCGTALKKVTIKDGKFL